MTNGKFDIDKAAGLLDPEGRATETRKEEKLEIKYGNCKRSHTYNLQCGNQGQTKRLYLRARWRAAVPGWSAITPGGFARPCN
jgi:hypothetical protein